MPASRKVNSTGLPQGARKQRLDERAARARAQRMLGLLAPEAVRHLRAILLDGTSTKFDRLSAIEKVLDRVIPRVTQAEMVFKNAAPLAFIAPPGFAWPGITVEDPTSGGEPVGDGLAGNGPPR